MRIDWESPEFAPVTAAAASPIGLLADRRLERRLTMIWGLLFFNTLSAIGSSLLALPKPVTQLMTMGALGLALLLALRLNRRHLVRPNLILGLFTVLAAGALMATVRGHAGLGGLLRAVRFPTFLAVLWLLTPWWGRRDLLLARCHLRALIWACASVLIGVLLSPSTALGGRLIGIVWPMPASAVGEFSAMAAGMAVVLWLSGYASRRTAVVVGVGGVAMCLLSQTRTMILAFGAGLACAGLTLFLSHRRARRFFSVVMIAAPIAAVAFAPALSTWLNRGQTSQEISGLTGRRQVWNSLLKEHRSEFDRLVGFGLSNKSFNGRPIDSTWLAVYQDEGLVGDVLVGAIVVYLLLAPAFRPAGPGRAVAVFLGVFVAVASYTEVGLGDVSAFLLAAVVAASSIIPDIAPTGG